LLLQSGRQSSVALQMTLQPGRQLVLFGESRGKSLAAVSEAAANHPAVTLAELGKAAVIVIVVVDTQIAAVFLAVIVIVIAVGRASDSVLGLATSGSIGGNPHQHGFGIRNRFFLPRSRGHASSGSGSHSGANGRTLTAAGNATDDGPGSSATADLADVALGVRVAFKNNGLHGHGIRTAAIAYRAQIQVKLAGMTQPPRAFYGNDLAGDIRALGKHLPAVDNDVFCQRAVELIADVCVAAGKLLNYAHLNQRS